MMTAVHCDCGIQLRQGLRGELSTSSYAAAAQGSANRGERTRVPSFHLDIRPVRISGFDSSSTMLPMLKRDNKRSHAQPWTAPEITHFGFPLIFFSLILDLSSAEVLHVDFLKSMQGELRLTAVRFVSRASLQH